jgi:hypothetical protein
MEARYRHRQVGWVVIGAMAPALLVVVPLAAIPGAPLGAILVAALVGLAGFAFSMLSVEIDAAEIRVSFSLGLPRKRIALADVQSASVVRNPWYYGWGIHKIPGGWIWNVSGLHAVELQLHDGQLLRIGSDEPERLLHAIHSAGAPLASAQAAAPAVTRRSHGPLFAVLVSLAVVAGAALLAVPLLLQTRPPKVTLTARSLAIESPFYGDSYPIEEMTAVSLERCLPRVQLRTNGFASGGLLRGWFLVQGLGKGKLFVDVSNPPFVLVRMRQGFVIVNLEDGRSTQALYERIEAARQAR